MSMYVNSFEYFLNIKLGYQCYFNLKCSRLHLLDKRTAPATESVAAKATTATAAAKPGLK